LSDLIASYLEVVKAAKAKQHFEDFKTGGRLSRDVEDGYQARMIAFSKLLEQGFVKLDAGFITFGILSPEAWLTQGLLNGDSEFWEFCDAYPVRSCKFNPDRLNLERIGR